MHECTIGRAAYYHSYRPTRARRRLRPRRLQKLRNLKWQAASWCSMSERSQICASVAPARREALRPRAVVACVPSLVGTPAAAVAAAGCASVSSRVPRRRALRRSGEVNGETDVRPNGLVGELHGPFTGELVSAAVPMDSRRRFKRVGLRLASLLQPGNRQRGVSCELLADEFT